jgi:two-component system KDP operon response regulator KdpE
VDKGRLILIHHGDQALGRVKAMLRGVGAELLSLHEESTAWIRARPGDADLYVIVLDLPRFDGMAALRAVRSQTNAPVIILGPPDKRLLVRYLDEGADDYLSMDHGKDVVLAKVRSYLRKAATRRASRESAQRYADDYLHINLGARLVTVNDVEVRLTPKEFELLSYLVRHAGEALTFEQILLHVWDRTCLDRPHYVHTYIARLRERLERDKEQPDYIHTVYGVGYRFAAAQSPET